MAERSADPAEGDSVVLVDLLGPGRIKPRLTLRIAPLPESEPVEPPTTADPAGEPAHEATHEATHEAAHEATHEAAPELAAGTAVPRAAQPVDAPAAQQADPPAERMLPLDPAPVRPPPLDSAITATLSNRLPLYYIIGHQPVRIGDVPATRRRRAHLARALCGALSANVESRRWFIWQWKREINGSLSRGTAPIALAISLIAATPAAASRPWPARKPPVAPPPAHQLADLARWPVEPPEPPEIDPARFRLGVDHLCARGVRRSARGAATAATADAAAPEKTQNGLPAGPNLGDLVQAAAAEAGIDPFLLAGLMFVQSGCRADRESRRGVGLLRIQPGMYRSPGAPAPPGEKDEWRLASLLDPAENLRLGAKLLQMWEETHTQVDTAFGGVPHRGAAAHFVWGDIVRGSGAEDQVLTARRRLIAFYLQTPEPTVTASFGSTLVCPLEGAPRVASSGPGEDRAGGKRRHRGIDLAAAIGEPVRAVADGKVMFAGANLPGRARLSVPPSRIARYRWRRMGAGGIYVCIEHAPERHIVTCYMHLDTYTVSEGDTVSAGQMIGRVGRTGVHLSPPHLHFELRIDERVVDPTRHLSSLVIPPRATQTYRLVMKAKRLRVAKGRAAKPSATQKL